MNDKAQQVEDIRLRRERDGEVALKATVDYIRVKGESYIGDIRRNVPAAQLVTISYLRELLGQLIAAGALGSEVRTPGQQSGQRSSWQRRYYWIAKR